MANMVKVLSQISHPFGTDVGLRLLDPSAIKYFNHITDSPFMLNDPIISWLSMETSLHEKDIARPHECTGSKI